ncbi:hypothetical protein ASG01_08195 [Chryseobacterium sp. Leaf180]|jgi:hypothetical protein|uniref:lipocalin family protein n=1 Tax=Chryseobacterium sp. Leaf180 TaxID=1736289 RepID=UPI0006FC83DD|nr:lipocalin family protein [Chryseobacterium sp. Leaf180]KQR93832.1 hypothetical protein ASG01_08195 [Chryseobacterium sp. Leaf180]
MKKLALIFAGLSLMAISGCNNSDDNEQPEYSMVGTWKPIREVRTSVPTGGGGVTDDITYTTCQQDGRWLFNENKTGKRTDKGEVGNPLACSTTSDRNLTYNYNKEDTSIEIKYAGTIVSDIGKVVYLDQTTMNLRIDDNTNPTVAKSTTYTLKRVQ